eukprot:CAMPEP_0116118718 /NCGR_PEP_ID=MMETSP0329-20121206/2256_1 /TAXON_ID=697910 /ORGANISM="Pseudo-nitzschia arenysensis, Strain B593" /LENGTH=462 /DNA_ID=CAMNT_0003612369 /DNA_START=89 /DNA_END=1474 /DNA_ORIENTATION=+
MSENEDAATPMSETSSRRGSMLPSSSDIDRWQSLSPMTIERAGAGGTCVNDCQFLVIGGVTETDETLPSSEFYDLHDREWHNLPIGMPKNLRYPGVAKIDGTLFVMGGKETNNSDPINDLFSIDLPQDLKMLTETKWKSLAPMKEARDAFVCASDSRYIYVFGGSDGAGVSLGTAERFDIKTNQWEILPKLPGGARQYPAIGMIGNKIYIIGGIDEDENPLASTIVFDVSKQEWESNNVSDMEMARFGASSVVVDHFIIVIGGWHKHFRATAEVFDTIENAWTLTTVHLEEEKALSTVGFFKKRNTIILAGGVLLDDEGPEVVNTVEMQFAYQTGFLPRKTKRYSMVGDCSEGFEEVETNSKDEHDELPPDCDLEAANDQPSGERIVNIRGVEGREKHLTVDSNHTLFDVRRLISQQWTSGDLQQLLGKKATKFVFYPIGGTRISLREEKYIEAYSAHAHEW